MPSPGVRARVDRFWRAVRRLGEIRSAGVDAFLRDENLVDAAERNLQVAVEALIDVCEALISYMRWRTPRSYRDIGRVLREEGVLSGEDAATFEEAVRLRRILVHNYVYIGPREVYEAAGKLREELVRVAVKALNYMRERGIDPRGSLPKSFGAHRGQRPQAARP